MASLLELQGQGQSVWLDYISRELLASGQLARLALANTPAASVAKIPYWENLYPGAANATLSATQRVYQRYLANSPDFAPPMPSLTANA